MPETILRVEKLVKNYGSYRAVDNISFEIKKGQVLGLLGPNGAGKSTTIQILVGITKPTGGKISYFGMDFSRHRQACLQKINFTSAYNTLQGRISVRENLLVFAGLYKVDNPKDKVAQLLKHFEISHLADHNYWDLSAGERTRVNIIKSLLNDPELILMDEPTASLDPDIADKTLSLIENLRLNRNLSILFTSHNMGEVERICDEVIFLDKGSIVSQGSPSDHTSKISEVKISLRYKGSEEILRDLLDKHDLRYEMLAKGTVIIESKKDKLADVISLVNKRDLVINDIEINKPDLEQVFLEIARRDK